MPAIDVSRFPDSAVHLVGPDARASKDFRRLCMAVEMCMSCVDETVELIRAPVWFYFEGFWYACWRAEMTTDTPLPGKV